MSYGSVGNERTSKSSFGCMLRVAGSEEMRSGRLSVGGRTSHGGMCRRWRVVGGSSSRRCWVFEERMGSYRPLWQKFSGVSEEDNSDPTATLTWVEV